MSVPRTVAEILREHVTLEVEGIAMTSRVTACVSPCFLRAATRVSYGRGFLNCPRWQARGMSNCAVPRISLKPRWINTWLAPS